MKVLILGSDGFVGCNLSRGLTTHEIISADLLPKHNQKNYAQFNICDFDSVKNTIKDIDVVINLVTNSLTSSLQNPIKNAEVNIIGLLNVLEAIRLNDIKKIIFTSASSLIGQPQTTKVTEKHPALPQTAYGITKLASEHYLRLYQEMYGIRYVIFRFFNIYGPYQKNGLIPTFYTKIKRKEPLTVFGKGNQIRDYVYIKDILPFFEKAISTTIADNQILNLGTGKGTSIIQVIKIMSEIMSVMPIIEYKVERSGEIGNFVANTSNLRTVFDTVPSTTIEEGLKHTISWLNEINDNYSLN